MKKFVHYNFDHANMCDKERLRSYQWQLDYDNNIINNISDDIDKNQSKFTEYINHLYYLIPTTIIMFNIGTYYYTISCSLLLFITINILHIHQYIKYLEIELYFFNKEVITIEKDLALISNKITVTNLNL